MSEVVAFAESVGVSKVVYVAEVISTSRDSKKFGYRTYFLIDKIEINRVKPRGQDLRLLIGHLI
jgi:hypothetical protein